MSATNRGSERSPRDYYVTPSTAILSFLEHHKILPGTILDPGAGDGAFGKAIKMYGLQNRLDAVEIQEKFRPELIKTYNRVKTTDYLGYYPKNKITTIMGNPPFSLATDFIEHSFELAPDELILLLRLPFLESQKRFNFWQEYPVNKLYILATRPSFTTDGGNDATAYAFFVWDGSNNQEIHVISGEYGVFSY